MRSRRVSPVLVWLAVATVCAAVIGGSFAYAAAVGDPLVREEAARRPPPPVTYPNGVLAIPGSGSGSGSAVVGGFSLDALGIDPAASLPPSACLAPLARVAADPTTTVEAVGVAWTAASDCAITQGSTPIDLDRVVGDPTLQPCVATFLARETLRYRAPATPTRPLDLLLQTCLLNIARTGPTSRSTTPTPGAIPSPGAVPSVPRTTIAGDAPDDVAPLPPGDSLPTPGPTTSVVVPPAPTTTVLSPAAVP